MTDTSHDILEKLFFKLLNSGTSAIELHEAKKIFGELILLNDLIKRKEPEEARCSVCDCNRQIRVSAEGSSACYSIPVEIAELFFKMLGFTQDTVITEICLRCETFCKISTWKKETS